MLARADLASSGRMHRVGPWPLQFCPLHRPFPCTLLFAGAALSRSQHSPGGLQFPRRQGWGWPAHAEQAQPRAWAGVSHLNTLWCCSAVGGQAVVLLLSSNSAYATVLGAAEQRYCSVPGGWQRLSLTLPPNPTATSPSLPCTPTSKVCSYPSPVLQPARRQGRVCR